MKSYMEEIRSFKMIEKKEEYMMEKSYKENEEKKEEKKMVKRNMRIVEKIEMGYRGYGMKIGEVI